MFLWALSFLGIVAWASSIPLIVIAPVLLCVSWLYPRVSSSDLVFVIVLGDVGHSPRTFNQVVSLIGIGKRVVLFGFSGSELPHGSKEFLSNGTLRVVYLKQFQFKSIPSRLLRYLLKTIAQSVFLAASLFITCASASEYPRHISVQNPPSIPSLLIAFVFAQLFDAKFVIDWHNYGYSIMALQKANSFIVRIATIYEKVLARMSDANFTVTKAMMNDVRSWGASNIRVLYDKPHCRFHRLDHAARNEFLLQIQNQIPSVEKVLNGVPLLVSATSWTEDEDFSILLDALSICNESKMEMVVVITGKGPQKEFYLAEIKRRAFQHISIVTPWLEVEDYPKLLGSATLGVSLHSSSSGLDLPMKGLPVFALNFPALPELVKDGRNGRIFNNSEELANLILTGLKDKNQLDDWRDFIEATRESWSDHWSNTAKEIFL